MSNKPRRRKISRAEAEQLWPTEDRCALCRRGGRAGGWACTYEGIALSPNHGRRFNFVTGWLCPECAVESMKPELPPADGGLDTSLGFWFLGDVADIELLWSYTEDLWGRWHDEIQAANPPGTVVMVDFEAMAEKVWASLPAWWRDDEAVRTHMVKSGQAVIADHLRWLTTELAGAKPMGRG